MMEDVQLSPEQEAMKERLQKFEEEQRRKKEEELKNIYAIALLQFKDECQYLTKQIPAEKKPDEQVIMDERENEEFIYQTNITYLERILDFSLRSLFKEAENKVNSLKINWNRTIIENSEEENKKMIQEGYEMHISMFSHSCEVCSSQASYLLSQAKKEFENHEGINGTANVLINFQYIAVVPMEEIVEFLESIEESIIKLIDLLQDQNGNGKEEEANNIQRLARQWFDRDSEIQEKQFDLLNALKGHPADQELRSAMYSFMEEYLSLRAEQNSPQVWRFKLYASIDNIDALQNLEPTIAKCLGQYKELAGRMRTFFEASASKWPMAEGEHTMV